MQVVLRHAAGDMRMVVLDADLALHRQRESEPGAHIVRVQVIRHRLRFHAEELLKVGQRFFEELEGFVILQIADVLAENGVPVFGDAESVLQLSSAGKKLMRCKPQIDWLGHISHATGAAPAPSLGRCGLRNHPRAYRYRDCGTETSRPTGSSRSHASSFEVTIGSSLRLPLVITRAVNSDG